VNEILYTLPVGASIKAGKIDSLLWEV